MATVIIKPEMRFEGVFKRKITVLEGEELARLINLFTICFPKRMKKHGDFLRALTECATMAYIQLYGEEIVSARKLKDLSTADARKLELFYQGAFEVALSRMKKSERPKGMKLKPLYLNLKYL